VSWELASFLIVAAVLLGGFAWYERSRPPSQVVALVAALAALAIAGRIAFAAFPNVKPTTDIVIFAGYALGGAPGFVVGALAALVSNFWFGQGPWTPWQMVGWGLCGLLGAGLALGVRNVGRLTLAATCGLAGIAYGALLNFSLMATYGGDLSWRHFALLEGRAVPFDAAHAIGNVAFALLAGPAMVRMLIRFRRRFEWGRGGGEAPARPPRAIGPALRGGGVAALFLLVALALGALAPPPARAAATDVSAAANWLELVQNRDGGFGASRGDDSGTEMTAWAMMGLEAAGRNPLDVARAGHTPVEFLRAEVGQLSSPGDYARTILALEGAGVDPREVGGVNLVARLLDLRRSNGSFEGWPNSTAFAVVALRLAGATGGLERTLSWLRAAQNDDGGWGDRPGLPSNADSTGAVMQALDSNSNAVRHGLSYLRQAQRKGGGFPLGGNGGVNTQSTAWAIQGILAAGANPAIYRRGGFSAPQYLAGLQQSDGHYRYSGASDQTPIWVTGQVLVAAAGDSLPIAPPARKPPSASPQTSFNGVPPGLGTSELVPVPSASPLPSQGAGAGAPPERFATPGQSAPDAPATGSSPGGRVREGSDPGAPEASASQAIAGASADPSGSGSSSSSSTGTTGSVLLGLLAGCLLFAAAWAGRRGWMHWRYGI
jgi:energy-coupling factor transport system substrate-specific component